MLNLFISDIPLYPPSKGDLIVYIILKNRSAKLCVGYLPLKGDPRQNRDVGFVEEEGCNNLEFLKVIFPFRKCDSEVKNTSLSGTLSGEIHLLL